MSKIDLKKLQNGSDLRGVAMDGIEGENINLGKEEAVLFGYAFASWLNKSKNLKIAVGMDSRLTGEMLKSNLILGINSFNDKAKVFDCGLASTPAMFMSTIFENFDCDGAIMITASHLPFNRNGFKFFSRKGGLDKKDISKIIQIAETARDSGIIDFTSLPGSPQCIQSDLISTYSQHLISLVKKAVNSKNDYEKPLMGLKIIVDAGNGAGGFYASKVLAPLGADITGSQFLEPDGNFPNHIPNPEDKVAMESISSAVLSNKADLGLIFDTDVDRSSAVDSKGREINRNSIVALAAALVAEDYPGTTVVTDSITSDELGRFIKNELGLVHHRFKRGYKNVINESIRLNEEGTDSQLAIETSGHAALKENYFLDDGAYLATKIVIKAAKLAAENKTIYSLIEKLGQPKESKEIRIKIKLEEDFDFAAYGDKIIDDLELFAHVGPGMRVVMPNYEGTRIAFDKSNGDGWCLLRKSLHDPLMPLNIESRAEGGCKIIEDAIMLFLKQYDKLQI